MPLPLVIQRYGALDFLEAVEAFAWGRSRITEVHWHHTGEPTHADFGEVGGERLVRQMYEFHTFIRGWRHTGQHVSIDPDGFIWMGRPWNLGPASATNHNGVDNGPHPFMFEMIGDLRHGRDPVKATQIEAAAIATAIVQRKFKLQPEALRFHKEMQATACPGDLDKDMAIATVADMHVALADGTLDRCETYAPLRWRGRRSPVSPVAGSTRS